MTPFQEGFKVNEVDVLTFLFYYLANPWALALTALGPVIVALILFQGWLLPSHIFRFGLIYGVLSLLLGIGLVLFHHPLIWGLGLMLVSAVVLRFQGYYTVRPHPGPIFVLLNVLFLATWILLTYLPSLPAEFEALREGQNLILLIWGLLNLGGSLAVTLRMKGWRPFLARRAGLAMVLSWFPALALSLVQEISGFWAGALELPDILARGGAVTLLSMSLPSPLAIVLWAFLVSETALRKSIQNEEHRWSHQVLNVLLEAQAHQMQLGSAHRSAFYHHTIEDITRSLQAAGAALFLVDPYLDVLRPVVVHSAFPPLPNLDFGPPTDSFTARMDRFLQAEIGLDYNLLAPSIENLKVNYYPSVTQFADLETADTRTDWEDLCLLVAPLHYTGKLVGILAATFLRAENKVQPRTMRRFKDLASWLSKIIYTLLRFEGEQDRLGLELESQRAGDIQTLMKPKRLPRLQSVGLASLCRPAVGVHSDYYDVIPLRKGEFLLVIADVAGKGLEVSLTLAAVRNLLHLLAQQKNMGPSRLLGLINWALASKMGLDRVTTMSIAHFDLKTKQLTYSSAAHQPILVYRSARKTFESLQTEGIPLGLEKSSKYHESFTRLEKNDIIVLYTDGVIEAVNEDGELFGLERMKGFLLANSHLQTDKLKRGLEMVLDNFSGNTVRQDDQTILLMRVERL